MSIPTPSVQVFVPNFNYGRYLGQCVRSALAEEIDRLSVTIIDNASTDDSLAVAHSLAAEDARVRIVANPCNRGAKWSYDHAIDIADGDFMMTLCADDVLKAGVLRQAVEALAARPEVIFVAGTSAEPWFGEDAPEEPAEALAFEVIDGDWLIESLCHLRQDVAVGELLVRTAAQKRAGRYRADLRHWDDLDMMLRLATLGPAARFAGSFVRRRIHADNLSVAMWRDRFADLKECELAIDGFLAERETCNPRDAGLRRSARRTIAATAYWSAASRLVRGDRPMAGRLLRYAVDLDPSIALRPPLGHLLRMRSPVARFLAACSSALAGPYERENGKSDGAVHGA